MALKVYADRMSQPSRAIIIFCKVNRIEFEEVRIDLSRGQHRSPQFREINPMGQVPAIVDGRFKLFERYPADLFSRAKIDSILDWHHSNLRRGAVTFVLNSALAPALGLPLNPQAASEAAQLLSSSLSRIESIWLKGNSKFLLGNSQPSIADLSLVCEIMQLEVVDEKDRERILGPHEKILNWIDNVKRATSPHFEEVSEVLYKVKARLQSKPASSANQNIQLNFKAKASSKL
ncbi:Glutathione S-transferase T1 [Ananas comosus]|uniref:Glutathione S-transferase T1 n=1 Tax=Ananas comosus TaxID=4615 RepID=A0A199W149_ANACO|nr:Glutathione S-transferase T1 [Ananas comosus]